MPGYRTKQEQITIGGVAALTIRSLLDKQQFADPLGAADRLGISSAAWPLFGLLWPSGSLLAARLAARPVAAGERILELGCGLGLASLVLQRRGADIVASDVHPLAEIFLAYNAALNALPAVSYRQLRWDVPLPALGKFDLIIGSDVLYERDHAAMLASLVRQHAHAGAEVLITDPGRGNSAPFTRALSEQGFDVVEERSPMDAADTPPYRGRLLHYRRRATIATEVMT